MEPYYARLYRRVEIALKTGWTFDYIDNLGLIDEASIVEILEAKSYF